jgi:hypothetical protein
LTTTTRRLVASATSTLPTLTPAPHHLKVSRGPQDLRRDVPGRADDETVVVGDLLGQSRLVPADTDSHLEARVLEMVQVSGASSSRTTILLPSFISGAPLRCDGAFKTPAAHAPRRARAPRRYDDTVGDGCNDAGPQDDLPICQEQA